MLNNRNLSLALDYKKIGFSSFNKENLSALKTPTLQAFIKVMLVPKGYTIKVDFNRYTTSKRTLFFVSPNQYMEILNATNEDTLLIHYNRDFYCIQIHDAEVACDGLLFNNIFENPKVELGEGDEKRVTRLFEDIYQELSSRDSSGEEMIRAYLKLIIIRATREWKRQNLQNDSVKIPNEETDFFRNFSRLLEIHFREKHSVADYADILNIAPKTLSVKFNKLNLENPNEIIKNRIVLEAKRLLLYTDMSIKEIAYTLGYDDPAYFNRLFTQKSGNTPVAFKKNHKLV